MKYIIPMVRFMDIPKIKIIYHVVSTCYFGYFGDSWPHQSKMIVLTFAKL